MNQSSNLAEVLLKRPFGSDILVKYPRPSGAQEGNTMKKVNHTRSRLAGKGFYIALAISLLAVAVATVIAISRTVSSSDSNRTLSSESSVSSAAQTAEQQSNIPKSSTSSSSASSQVSASSSASSDPASQTAKKTAAQSYAMPLSGEIINDYSNGELVKSETMGDWRTHDGIDIAAPKATPVKACGDGTVTDIKQDGMWGTCITIDHGNGIQSIYCGLNETVQVKPDQQVKIGEVIGSVGETNQLESALPEHLHFAMKKDGKWVNPTEYIKQ